MEVTTKVTFGDIADIMRGDKVIQSEGGTINFTLNTCREFTPGKYILNLVKENLIIFCLDTVDPVKIKEYLMKTDIGSDFRAENHMNRYDWMHHRNWPSDENEVDETSPFINYITKYNKLLLRHCFITLDIKKYR